MIHSLWLLLIIPVSVFMGVLVAALCGASKMADLRQIAEMERKSLADTLRLKSLEADRLGHLVQKMMLKEK